MSLTLGEKLREAREERGISITEVAEQTRISSLYLESIEHDDYRTLPGGIFNKGFVKSYAKFVGLNEQEALADYAKLQSNAAAADDAELKVYKPEVLTDDRAIGSMVPTVIVAVVILALMTGGILFLVKYLRQPPSGPVTANTGTKAGDNPSSETPASGEKENVPSDGPDMASLKVEFKATTPVKILVSVDEEGSKTVNISAGSSTTFSPKQTLVLNYNRWNASNVQLLINGKTIELPSEPLDAKDRDRIIFTISKGNIAQIISSGKISTQVPSLATDANANVAAAANTSAAPISTPVRPAVTPSPKPSVAANTADKPAPDKKPSETPKPISATPKPTPKATPKPGPKPPANTQ